MQKYKNTHLSITTKKPFIEVQKSGQLKFLLKTCIIMHLLTAAPLHQFQNFIDFNILSILAPHNHNYLIKIPPADNEGTYSTTCGIISRNCR